MDNFILLTWFVSLWVGASFLKACLTGWRRLAAEYRAAERFQGSRWPLDFLGMGVRVPGYGRRIIMGANSQGLWLSAGLLLRVAHPPLFIPWRGLSLVRAEQVHRFTAVQLRARRVPEVPFVLWLAPPQRRWLAAAAGSAWPGPSLLDEDGGPG
jgi:hypothetical protein